MNPEIEDLKSRIQAGQRTRSRILEDYEKLRVQDERYRQALETIKNRTNNTHNSGNEDVIFQLATEALEPKP